MPELGDLPSPRPCTFAAIPNNGSVDNQDGLDAVFKAQRESIMSGDAEKVEFKRDVWQCANTECNNRDMSELEPNTDSELVCPCGFVAKGVRQISIPRAKMCADSRDQPDPTRNADDGVQQTAEEAKYEAMLNGPESKEDARRRAQLYQGGTRMNTKRLQRNGLLQAQNCIDAQKRRENNEEAVNAPDERVKNIITKLEQVFDQLPSLKDTRVGIGRYIRAEGMRISALAWRHERVCKNATCMYSLSRKTAMGVAYAIVELVLTALLDDEELIAVQSGGEMTKQHVEQIMKEFTTFQIHHNQGMSRMQMLSTVGLIAEWEAGEEYNSKCDSIEPAPTGARRPPSTASSSEYGRVTSNDPGDNTLKLRDALWAAGMQRTVGTSVRTAAMDQLAVSEVVTFSAESNLPVELIAIGILAATAARMGQDNPVATLGNNLATRHQIAASTLDAFAEQVAPLLKIAMPPPASAVPRSGAATSRFCN